MNRRHFLSLIGASPLVARSYFDMGQAWQKHASGLLLPPQWIEIVMDGRTIRWALPDQIGIEGPVRLGHFAGTDKIGRFTVARIVARNKLHEL